MSIADNRPRVLVAGGASGVGLACAEAFAARGSELILVDCDGIALTRAAERLGAFSRYCDAIGSSSVELLMAELAGLFPSIDILINAVGSGYVRTLAMTRLTQAILPLLRRATGCRLVINIPSAGCFMPPDEMFPYASSLQAFDSLSEMLRELTRGTGIEVVNVAPKLAPVRPANPLWSDRLFELQSVNERETALRILDIAAVARPEWRQRSPDVPRRA